MIELELKSINRERVRDDVGKFIKKLYCDIGKEIAIYFLPRPTVAFRNNVSVVFYKLFQKL